MPWKIQGNCVHKMNGDGSMGEVVKCHDSPEDARAHMRALYASENSTRIAFEPFGKLEAGKPLKLLPTGTWHRGDRKLDITPTRLSEAVANFKRGLPRFRIGINLDHREDEGKVGDIKDLAYLKDGPQGEGLYATEYELTPKGQKAIEEDGYDAVSAEVVWSLNDGARYQDPETGDLHDNVITGLALTPRPFFGHREVALFSAGPGDIVGRKPQEDSMDEKFAEQLAVKQQEVDKLTADLKAAQERSEQLEAKIEAEKLEARKAELKTEAETFEALSIPVDKYVETMLTLTPEQAGVIKGWLLAADEAAKALLNEQGTELSSDATESEKFLAAVQSIQNSEKVSYTDAFALAEQKFPALAHAYAAR